MKDKDMDTLVEGPVSILNPEYHARLLAEIERFADIAGVPVSMVHEPMAKYCTEEEIKWVRQAMLARDRGVAGLCITGIDVKRPIERKMMAMACAFLRNYVDARVVSIDTLLSEHKDGDVESPTVLLIPNLYLEMAGGKPHSTWHLSAVQDILMRRLVERKLTIIYVQDLVGLKRNYGESIKVFIEASWTVL